jgi:hypothetical protein
MVHSKLTVLIEAAAYFEQSREEALRRLDHLGSCLTRAEALRQLEDNQTNAAVSVSLKKELKR